MPAGPGVCKGCESHKAFTRDLRTCPECGKNPDSGTFKICAECALKLNKCRICQQPLSNSEL
ncbi:E3 ubiquitin-protein ligase [Acrasis kona]|uniref:E3 ubiquitin-protein ligase n=1 Tax=Acrasis kona TaxID=1008807 RepID=A0AAW2Z056_9EUKA